jgi:hypothetical protein
MSRFCSCQLISRFITMAWHPYKHSDNLTLLVVPPKCW